MYQYVVEFIGTFIFLSVILASGQPLPIAAALAVAIYFGGKVSGGHFNPAVSVMKHFQEGANASVQKTAFYIAAQVLGGLAALYFHKQVNKQ